MLIPFKKEHFEVMDMRPHERLLIELSGDGGAGLEQSVCAKTGIIDGRVIACGGAIINIYGAADIWLIPSVYVSQHKLRFLKTVLQWLDEIRTTYNVTRMQTVALDDDLHNEYMRFIGFEKEGKMRQYALGHDFNMWGRVWAHK